MFCSKCGVEIPDDAVFCYKCGAQTVIGSDSIDSQNGALSLRCPDCGAQLTYGSEIDHVTCNFCGSVIMLNDDAARKDRILKAESNAIIRDTATRIRYENEQHKRELETMSLANEHKLSPYKDLTPIQRLQYRKEKKEEAELKAKELEVKQAEIDAKYAEINAKKAPYEEMSFAIVMGLFIIAGIIFIIFAL